MSNVGKEGNRHTQSPDSLPLTPSQKTWNLDNLFSGINDPGIAEERVRREIRCGLH